MASKSSNLVWLDLEMTGLDVLNDKILEIATVITDKDLNILAEGPNLAIYQTETVLDNMHPWCIKQHGSSGLTARCQASKISVPEAEQLTLKFLRELLKEKENPLCGNSICTDRRFLAQHMPELEDFFHYRNVDVSTIKEIMGRWRPDIASFAKSNTHLALDDIKESIAELSYYREVFFKLNNINNI